MKNNLIALAITGAMLMSACGPSAEEKAAAEKATQDSIAAAQKAVEDSLMMAQQAMQDSMNAVMEKMRMDSIAMADSLAKMKSTGGKKPKAKKEEPKKPETIGQGKPKMGSESTPSDTSKTIGKGKPKMGGK